jgi:Lrp/AsnC family leucine-responsive transcriptional regulator
MRPPNKKRRQILDEINWAILSLLQENARTPYSKLAKRVGLSVPATIERIRKLEDTGIITCYHAQIDAKALGLPILAVIRCSGTGTQLTALASRIDKIPQVIKAYRMSGDTCFLAIVVAESTEHLEKLLNAMSAYVQASTSIVVSTPLAYRSLGPSAFQSG